jgi:hypothetical protein
MFEPCKQSAGLYIVSLSEKLPLCITAKAIKSKRSSQQEREIKKTKQTYCTYRGDHCLEIIQIKMYSTTSENILGSSQETNIKRERAGAK